MVQVPFSGELQPFCFSIKDGGEGLSPICKLENYSAKFKRQEFHLALMFSKGGSGKTALILRVATDLGMPVWKINRF